ncbi:MAG: flagellar motor protein MotB [Pseudomonadota bacterium]
MSDAQPIILKKKKVSGGDGHHGGAWKVAYADFVTAMMAFFLLMWLLNATSEEQRKGLADYFDPTLPISRSSAGGAGMLAGDTMFAPNEASGSRDEGVQPKPTNADPGEDLGELEASPDWPESDQAPNTVPWRLDDMSSDDAALNVPAGRTPAEDGAEVDASAEADADDGTPAEAALNPNASAGLQADLQEMNNLAEDLAVSLAQAGDIGLIEHFSLRVTPEGLVIELTDITNEPLFPSGSIDPAPVLETLVEILVPVLQQTTNDIAIEGHTDATPFTSRRNYSNWELSAERANSARRIFEGSGLAEDRIVRVSGRAATDPIVDDPNDAQNRRIAITLLRNQDRPNSGQ